MSNLPTTSQELTEEQAEEQEKEYAGLTPQEIEDIKNMQSGFAKQNRSFGLWGVALAAKFASKGAEVHSSIKTLEEINAEELIKNPEYRKRVIEAVHDHDQFGVFLQRDEKGKGRANKAKKALEQVKKLDAEQDLIRNQVSAEYTRYFQEMKINYGLTSEQVKKITEQARKTAKEQGISVRDAMRIEARKTVLRDQAKKEVEQETQGQRLTNQERENLIEARTKKLDGEKGEQFIKKTQVAYESGEKLPMKQAHERTQGVIEKNHPKKPPKPAPISRKEPITRRLIRQSVSYVTKPLTKRYTAFVLNERARIAARFQKARQFFANSSLGKAIAAARRQYVLFMEAQTARVAARIARFTSFLSKSPVGQMFRGFQNFLGGQIGRIRNRLNAINAFKGKAVDLALNALSTAFPPGKALKFALDGLDKLAQLLGMGSVKGKIFDVTVMIGVILIGAILLPFLLLMTSSSSQPFASVTLDNPQVITARGEFKRVYSWKEFSTEFLAEQKNVKNEIFNNWMYFSKTFLSETQEISVLNPNRHDDVKE